MTRSTQIKTVFRPIYEWAEYESIRGILKPGAGAVRISGCVRSQKTHLAMALADGTGKGDVLITVCDEREGRMICREIEALGYKVIKTEDLFS